MAIVRSDRGSSRHPAVRGRWRACASLLVGAAAIACEGPGPTECLCGDPTVRIDVPADRAAALEGIQLSGVACASVTPGCLASSPQGCTTLGFRALDPGQCVVDVQFASGAPAFEATLSFVRLPCCPGVYAEPPESATIQVPPMTGASG